MEDECDDSDYDAWQDNMVADMLQSLPNGAYQKDEKGGLIKVG